MIDGAVFVSGKSAEVASPIWGCRALDSQVWIFVGKSAGRRQAANGQQYRVVIDMFFIMSLLSIRRFSSLRTNSGLQPEPHGGILRLKGRHKCQAV